MKARLVILILFLFATVGCTGKWQPRALSFEVYTTRETRNDVVALVEQFATREHLQKSKYSKTTTTNEPEVHIDFADVAQQSAWMWVSNASLTNKDHVEVDISPLPVAENIDNKKCDICKKFEASDEMKKIKEKFKISTIVRNGEWWK